jgi:hypothetical protein
MYPNQGKYRWTCQHGKEKNKKADVDVPGFHFQTLFFRTLLCPNRISSRGFFSPRINYITEEAVQEFAIEKKIHPSIVVGILAFNEMVSYSTLHRFKETVKDQIPDKYRAD